jgi:hypothetical protein
MPVFAPIKDWLGFGIRAAVVCSILSGAANRIDVGAKAIGTRSAATEPAEAASCKGAWLWPLLVLLGSCVRFLAIATAFHMHRFLYGQGSSDHAG